MATQGEATLGEAGYGLVWQCMARQGQQGEIPALCSKGIIMTNYAVVWHGRARRGKAVPGTARCGQAWRGKVSRGISPALRSIFTNYTQGVAWHGQAWLGGAVRGEVWLGPARLGKGTGLQNPVHYA